MNHFKFYYNVFDYGSKKQSSYIINAETKEEAFIIFVAQSNVISFDKAKELIDKKYGKSNWKVGDVLHILNPLSDGLDLYEVLNVRKVQKKGFN